MMAIPALSPSEAPLFPHPPEEKWDFVRRWDLEENGRVSLYRKGDRLQYKWSQGEVVKKSGLDTKGDIESTIQELMESSVVVKENRVHFFRPISSLIDPQNIVTHEVWSLTLVCTGRSTGCNSSWNWLGHSVILIEKINDQGNYEGTSVDLTWNEETRRWGIEIEEATGYFRERWPRSDTYFKPKHLVIQMLKYAEHQKAAFESHYENGTPPPFNFHQNGYREGTTDKNCHTFSLDVLAVAQVIIPPVPLSLPFHPPYYIPRYSVGKIDRLCRILLKRGFEIDEFLSIELKQEINSADRRIKELKERLALLGIALVTCTIVPPFQLLLLMALPVGSSDASDFVREIKSLRKEIFDLKCKALEQHFRAVP